MLISARFYIHHISHLGYAHSMEYLSEPKDRWIFYIGEKLFSKTKQCLNWIGKVVGLFFPVIGLKLVFQTQE